MMINDTLNMIGTNLAKRDVALPALCFAGAAGSLAYGTYALITHLRDRDRYNFANIAKFTAPALVGSGLVYLGISDLRSGRSSRDDDSSWESSTNSERTGRGRGRGRGRQGGRGRGRGRRANATKP
jgi:hypothetical protein